MLNLLPPIARVILLVLAGGLVGSLINWAIYQLGYFRRRSISPWSRPAEQASPRQWYDFVPIIGWLAMRRDHKIHGTGFWFRPLAIELAWAIGLPWFYRWQATGGLTGGNLAPAAWMETWFYAHTILVALMFVATFIDFDERTIPDRITVTGTLFALCLAAVAPSSRLPEMHTGLAGAKIQSVTFASPDALPQWHHSGWGLLTAIGIFTVWILALLPYLITFQFGFAKSIQLMLAHIVRPRRKTNCDIRTKPRRPALLTVCLSVIWILGTIGVAAAFQFLAPANWDSLFGSLLGLAFAGGMVWSIRIVGSHAMQQEAMGFGDVTLMAMIGAFLGWQASLLTFAFAPFAALAIVLAAFLVTREHELAFGPYLCFSAFMILLNWFWIWNAARHGIFGVGSYLVIILAGSLVFLAAMLSAIRWFKDRRYVEIEERE